MILTSHVQLRSQIEAAMEANAVDCSTRNFLEASVFLTTYSGLKREWNKSGKLPRYRYVIFTEAETANKEFQKFFEDGETLIGFTGVKQLPQSSLFYELDPVFRYSLLDAVKDGFIEASFVPHYYDAAIEGFCERLFSALDLEIESRDKSGQGDFLIRDKDKLICVEYKVYRERLIPAQALNISLAQMQDVWKYRQRQESLLILFAEVSENIKAIVYEAHKITIWDISNLLWIAEQFPSLFEELIQLTPFSVSSITPKPPLGWNPWNLKAPYIIPIKHSINKGEELKARLLKCKTGKTYFQEYEEICTEIILHLFGEEFLITQTQNETKDELFRMDLLCSLKGNSSFWEFLIRHYNSRFVVFEFKNYSELLKQNLLFITEKYLFDAALRNVALIISRKGFSKNAQSAAEGCLKESRKLILDVTDEDLIKMLDLKANGEVPADYLLKKTEAFLMSIGK